MNTKRRKFLRRTRESVRQLAKAIRGLSDTEVGEVLGTGAFNELLQGIVAPDASKKYPTLHEFFLDYKNRLALLALVRHVITRNHAYRGHVAEGGPCVVSPFFDQWIKDGVVFLQSRDEPFGGIIGLYRQGKLSYAIASRRIEAGEQFDPREALDFLDVEEFKKRADAVAPKTTSELYDALNRLRQLVDNDHASESEFQELLQRSPWLLGLEYRQIDRHTRLDDTRIPDFTAVRARDDCCDIIEIKPPSMTIFRQDGAFHSEFNDAWNQAEGYLSFAIREQDYLARKRLTFDNPKCVLLAGKRVTLEQRARLKDKENLVPRMEFLTYDEVLRYAEHTVEFIQRLREEPCSDSIALEEPSGTKPRTNPT